MTRAWIHLKSGQTLTLKCTAFSVTYHRTSNEITGYKYEGGTGRTLLHCEPALIAAVETD